MLMNAFMDILGSQMALEKGFFLPFLTDFETSVCYLLHPFVVVTIELLAHTLCDCLPHTRVSSTTISVNESQRVRVCWALLW